MLGLFTAAHDHHHSFSSAAAAKNLNGAGFTDAQILAMAKNDQLDIVGGDAVMYRLIGLSDPTVQILLQRRLSGLPTMSAAEIGRLKNTQLTEHEILARIDNGMTDAQADAEATAREKDRTHSGTGFVRVHGRSLNDGARILAVSCRQFGLLSFLNIASDSNLTLCSHPLAATIIGLWRALILYPAGRTALVSMCSLAGCAAVSRSRLFGGSATNSVEFSRSAVHSRHC